MSVDSYDERIIGPGDEGSALWARICAPTLRNSPHVRVIKGGMNGVAVIKVPRGHYVLVNASTGHPSLSDISEHAGSLVDRLVEPARRLGATPIGLGNDFNSSTGDLGVIERAGKGLVERANKFGVAIMNGENAILGSRVNGEANILGALVSMIPKSVAPFESSTRLFEHDGTRFAVFDPCEKSVYVNNDGNGTKLEFNEKAKRLELGLSDSAEMKLSDFIKLGASARVIADVVETNQPLDMAGLETEARRLGGKYGFTYLLHHELVGDRIRSYKPGAFALNIGGTAVSVIDEEFIRNPLKPEEGNVLIAIRGNPNIRSNGATLRRETMNKVSGEEWHTTSEGRRMLEYFVRPSTILYGVFRDLISKGAATSVYHMSGGAYNGKLARPLAKHGLFVKIDKLFAPCDQELEFLKLTSLTAEGSYGKLPMGNDGFIATRHEEAAMHIIHAHGLEGRRVGPLQSAIDGRTGVELRAWNGEMVYFSGKD